MDDGLKHLRAQAMARHKAATQKVRRNELKGVALSGTKHDIRREPTNIAKYNKPQLLAYIAKLDQFVGRKTQFVADMHGKPLPIAKYRQLKKAERKFNNQKLSRAAAVGGIMLPPIVDDKGKVVAQQSVKERRDVLAPRRRRGSNPAVNNPWEPKNFQPWQINGEGSLKRLEKMLRDRATPEAQQREYRSQLKSAVGLLTELEAHDLIKRVKAMDKDKFYILFNHSGFVEEASTKYLIKRMQESRDMEAMSHDELQETHGNLGRLIGWAEKQRLGG
jgi:hypothetical protein